MEQLPRIGIDWNNRYGPDGYVLYLPCSTKDIEEQGIVLKEGLRVRIYGDVLEADAVITWYENKFWLAREVPGTLIEIGE
jgi:hypothetical protein